MGDENTLAGVTKAHKHSALSTDGGFLETTVTGVTNLSEGSIVYGDASEIVTELTAGATDTTLQINASGLPVWATAGAVGKISLIDNTVLGADATNIDTTFTSLTQGTDMSGILAIFNGARSNTTGMYLQVGTGGSLISTSTYDYQGIEIIGGSATYQNSPNNSIWEPYDSGNTDDHLLLMMTITASDPSLASTANQTIQFTSICSTGANIISFYGGTNSTSGVTSLDEIKLSSASGDILKGSSLSIYKIGL